MATAPAAPPPPPCQLISVNLGAAAWRSFARTGPADFVSRGGGDDGAQDHYLYSGDGGLWLVGEVAGAASGALLAGTSTDSAASPLHPGVRWHRVLAGGSEMQLDPLIALACADAPPPPPAPSAVSRAAWLALGGGFLAAMFAHPLRAHCALAAVAGAVLLAAPAATTTARLARRSGAWSPAAAYLLGVVAFLCDGELRTAGRVLGATLLAAAGACWTASSRRDAWAAADLALAAGHVLFGVAVDATALPLPEHGGPELWRWWGTAECAVGLALAGQALVRRRRRDADAVRERQRLAQEVSLDGFGGGAQSVSIGAQTDARGGTSGHGGGSSGGSGRGSRRRGGGARKGGPSQ